ncbi:pyridoxal phosphate-dependent aminotransferase [Oceanobacillus profundus]|uniref:Pyridoxal phosphate-dependent aminotransferase n=1 Tax=Oceanobacillus profundus TaxID=372463 RepID=A0A417YI77_9BACI|nr:pyridoxal phosphate-dependent aminotransferase [Oceanobacillus profundus]MCM3400109.1 pyridoxal phosphate-dependent aminotransferase [Oceanobacillus profundus]MDO6449884.1 pyridoxal phosphate-dependent aminotransferase [Oceanobacillus profundus]PAE28298.1 LL-diaminopimelate aminotransferase [Paenibacillus sp. 7884-2]RHW32670.1 pyridoxal phosphate-dependent aminotransferase [Oceanobacillus profundus]
MEFSNRLKGLPAQFFATLVQKVTAAYAEGRDVINLGQGNPDQPTPAHIVKALQQSAQEPITHKYSPFRGTTELKQAAADFYKKEYNVDLDPETEVAILFGTKIGLVELPLALMNDGELLLLPDPGYPDYLSGVGLANVRHETMPLLRENNFLPDYDSLSSSHLDKAKLLYLNYPNNPTGATASKAFFEKTVKLGEEHSIGIVHDFAYGAIGFDGNKPISFLEAEGAKDVGIELYTLSKTYNMAGWRVGFAVGNKEMIEAINLLQDHLFVSIFPAVQHAAAVALSDDQACVEALVALYEGRRNTLIAECQRIGWEVEAPKGSFFAWLPVPDGFTSETFADFLLEKADVAVAAGNGFGSFGEGYIRIGLLVEEQRIKEAIQRIEKLNIFPK